LRYRSFLEGKHALSHNLYWRHPHYSACPNNQGYNPIDGTPNHQTNPSTFLISYILGSFLYVFLYYLSLMKPNVFSMSSPKKLPKFVDKSVIELMLDKAKKDTSKHAKRNYLILLVLWRTGIRCSEVINIRKQDIQYDIIIIRGGKGGKDRSVPIDRELSDILSIYCDSMKPGQVVFPLSRKQVYNIVCKYNVEGYDIHPHTIRHSFAVHCLKNGMNIRVLQRILGHSSLSTTQIYLDLVGEDIKDEYRKVVW